MSAGLPIVVVLAVVGAIVLVLLLRRG